MITYGHCPVCNRDVDEGLSVRRISPGEVRAYELHLLEHRVAFEKITADMFSAMAIALGRTVEALEALASIVEERDFTRGRGS